MAMNFKTRGMSTPQGKPRVYFCCHPEDFSTHFETLSEEILYTQNCAIWYELSDNTLNKDHQLELNQMQLFVMPVTTKLLTTPNRALGKEFPFAIGNHIPVLPIMLEAGLKDLFEKKCHDLQFLDKTSHDPTMTGYEEKLENYLSSVLVGDELAAKVRAAFDAYIFLSYRKKDRRYAQELMRLIHQNDFCRDVAIWYDEYLVPGENFNTAIADMLQKSDLFALAVTPNLLEEPNYVLIHEYPSAIATQKPILPVEVVPTDIETLEQAYHGIPRCVHKGDSEGLSAALLDSLRHCALRQKAADPQHNFFIGLAYLNGIDVETDHERGKELIVDAAEAGLQEASRELVNMYRTGTGVARDYHEAIWWQKKLVELHRADYGRNQTEKNRLALISALWHLGDYELELGNLAAAKAAYQQMMKECFANAVAFESEKIIRYQLVNFNKLGDIYQREGNLNRAEDYFKKGLKLSRRLAEETGAVEARRDLALNYDNLGDICQVKGDFLQAKDYYEKGLELHRQLAEETGIDRIRRDLPTCYGKLGEICRAEGNLTQAKAYCEKSLELYRQLAEEIGSFEDCRNMLLSYSDLGDICRDEGNLTEAREYFEECLKLSRYLVKENGTVEARRDLAISYERLGIICQDEGNLTQAKVYCEKCLELRRQLVEETGTVEEQRGLLLCFGKLGSIYQMEHKLTQAKNYFEKCVDLGCQLAEETEIVDVQQDLATTYGNLGDICRAEGNLAQARIYYEKRLELSHQIVVETGTVGAQRNLLIGYGNLGDICQAEGNLTQAKDHFEKCLELSRQLAEETEFLESRRDLWVCYSKLGNICQAEGSLTQAMVYYEKALELSLQLAKETGAVDAQRNLLSNYNGLGDVCRAEGNLTQAKNYYEKSLKLSRQLVSKIGMVDDYDSLALSCIRIAWISSGQERYDMLTESRKIWEKLCKECPEYLKFRQRLAGVQKLFASSNPEITTKKEPIFSRLKSIIKSIWN